MTVLGVYDGHNAGAALIDDDGVVLAAVEEERFSRIKNHDARPGHDGQPVESIRYCLAQSVEPVTRLALGLASPDLLQDRAIANFDRRVAAGESQRLHRAKELGLSVDALRELPRRSQRARVDAVVAAVRAAGVSPDVRMTHVDHHAAHAGGAFLLSPSADALIVTLDGKGDDLSGSVSIGHGSEIERLMAIPTEDSLGHLYSAFTVACGLRPQRDEGKLQAMAAADRPDVRVLAWLHDRFQLDEQTGELRGRLGDGNIVGPYPDRRPEQHNRLVAMAINGVSPFAAAASVQAFIEDIVCRFVAWHLASTGQRTLVVSGGLFANVSLNRRLGEMREVDELHVHPAMTDAGIALGAAAVVAAESVRPVRLAETVLGPEYSDDLVTAAFRAEGYRVERPTGTAETVLAHHLAGGEIVARFVGRAEYGPRALGNRSILAPASDENMPALLNARLRRSAVMPFAPIARASDAERLFDSVPALSSPTRFMTTAQGVTPEARNRYPAIVHADGSGRPQIVDRGPLLALLDEFERLSGDSVLINTSFNLHDEPMVCRPEDAARSARAAGIATVQIGHFVAHLE